MCETQTQTEGNVTVKKGFVKTENFKRLAEAQKLVERRGAREAGLVLVKGHYGIGKSELTERWAADSSWVFVRAKVTWTKRALLDELADKMGFTGAAKDTFLATVERYNELYDKQNDEDFGKPAYRLSAIRTAPFYGCWLGASLLTTEQGIAINEKGQALDNNNQPMEGLYITGDMSGSFFANNYPCLMAGVAMGRTLTFAMKAVKQMAGLDNA